MSSKHDRTKVNFSLQWRHNEHDASQITSLTIVYSTVYPDADQRKYQSSASLAFVWVIHRWPVNSPHKWPVTRKMFPFDDVIMVTNSAPKYTTVVSWAKVRNKSWPKYFFSHLKSQVTWLLVFEGNPLLYILYVKIEQGLFNQGLTSLVKGATGVIIYLTLGHDVRSLQVALTPCSYVSE